MPNKVEKFAEIIGLRNEYLPKLLMGQLKRRRGPNENGGKGNGLHIQL